MDSNQRDRIKVILIGAWGKMGRVLSETIQEEKDMELLYGIEKKGHPKIGSPFGRNFLLDQLDLVIAEGDCLVDFSEKEAVMENLERIKKGGKPYLCGVTGFRPEEFEKLRELANFLPFLYAPNFARGINILFRVLYSIVRILPEDYEIKIIETHHRFKKDAPSGTAKEIGKIIEGIRSDRVEIISLRIGDIIGEHKVIFAAYGEKMEITHSALSRQAFARGVLQGIRFIVSKPKGFYTMADVLSL